jgi:hypothetical protein
LIEAMLNPMESEWLRARQSGPVVERVKKLRTAILPKLLEDQMAEPERERLWRQIADCYLAQQLDCYPGDYLAPPRSQDRILETVERFEEDLTDTARIHGPLKAVIQFDDAIPVDPGSHAIEASALDFPESHPFWGGFTRIQSREIVHADSSSSYREYYPNDRLKKTWGAGVYPTEYTYDAQGRVRTIKTWRNHSADSGVAITTLNYNKYRGWLDNKRYHDGLGPDYTYTAGGRPKSRLWARSGSAVPRAPPRVCRRRGPWPSRSPGP